MFRTDKHRLLTLAFSASLFMLGGCCSDKNTEQEVVLQSASPAAEQSAPPKVMAQGVSEKAMEVAPVAKPAPELRAPQKVETRDASKKVAEATASAKPVTEQSAPQKVTARDAPKKVMEATVPAKPVTELSVPQKVTPQDAPRKVTEAVAPAKPVAELSAPKKVTPRDAPRKVVEAVVPAKPVAELSVPKKVTPRDTPRKVAEAAVPAKPVAELSAPKKVTPRDTPRKVAEAAAPAKPVAELSAPKKVTPRDVPKKVVKATVPAKPVTELSAPKKVMATGVSEKVAATGPYDGSWESLQNMPIPAWFDDGKVGIFIHWGPYSAIGYRKGGSGYSEHVPKLLYSDPEHYYPYMQERWGAVPPEFGYKDIIPEFKAENWDPDAWADLFAEVGAKYVVMTAEHHDGWANWDSELTPWNAVDMGPKRDLVGDLGQSLKKRGLKYAPSYHRERHQSFFAKKLYVVDAKPHDAILEEIKRVPEAASLYGPFGTNKAFVDSYVARWKEIQEKYKPDFLWMDDFPIYTRDGNKVRKGIAKPEVQYFDDQVRLMITDFLNDADDRGADVYVNNKGRNRNWPDGVGNLEKDNLKLDVIGPKWQSCTTFGTSFGYLEGDVYKTVEEVIHEMVEVISRNGNFLINIGPKADGSIPEPQLERLKAMGDWLRVNNAAIYGSRYWKVSDQPDEQLAFTTKGKNLYAIKLQKPEAPFTITAMAGEEAQQIQGVRLLGSNATVEWKMTAGGLQITPPSDLGAGRHAWAFEIKTNSEQHSPNVIVKDAEEALRGTKKVDLDGYHGGKRH